MSKQFLIAIILLGCSIMVVPMVIILLNACFGWDKSILAGMLKELE